MNRQATTWLAAAASVLLLAGCEETISNQAKAHVPAAAPQPVMAELHQALPLTPMPYSDAMLPGPEPAIDALVARARAAFEAGQKEYQAGNLDGARVQFDRAEQMILSSGFQVDADAQLGKLFDQIGSAMENYEHDAAAQNAEEGKESAGPPSPIDELADMDLPAGDPRLEAKADQELMRVPHDIPLTVNDSVLQYLSYFTTPRGREVIERGLEREGRYDKMIRRVLKEEGVPEDLIYLAQAESAFQPTAVSRSGARGLWQFMPFRGEEYDLDRSYWVDERSDPEKATRAAARHFRDLYDMFGDWYLVMAAYNSGPLTVIKGIERTGYADFWELQKRHVLPRETQNYVPIILALAMVGKDPALYGIQVTPDKPEPVDTVMLGHPISLHLVADATGTDIEDLRTLNPELLRNTTPADPTFTLKLPAGTGDRFKENIQQVPPDKWTSWRLHSVESGESLAEISRQYRVTLSSVEQVNHLDADAALPSGFLVTIPAAPPVAHLVHYRVQRGDTLEGIAERFDVTTSDLRRWNHLRSSQARHGMVLRIYAGGQPESRRESRSAETETRGAVKNVSENGDPVQHRVRRGETLYSIAHAYRVSVDSLKESNPFLAERPLQAGDVLTVER
ncbi:MAG TPA: LysM peptidoglycan-binding domain-containing protein [Candidatus Acidoferrum sp.]|nr:LysM peptidoglycan-binding domain-containing protein [Candidatus Acidoferrum sp.]